MKAKVLHFPLAMATVLFTHGQVLAQIVSASGLSSSYSVVSRGPNDRVWARLDITTDAQGNTITNVSSYTELATGMHYWQSNQWNQSQELIELYPDGAIAQHGQHKVIFANNLNTTGAIDLQTPDGKELRSRILGLSYFDAATGQSVLIAATTNSVGVLTRNNEVVYPKAFDDVAADVQYVYTRAGLEQNVVLRASLPSPAGFGLNPATTRLQVLTEFFSPPTPAITSTVQADGGVDEHINFGAMQIGKGRAFSVGSETNALIAVRKQWTVLDNRTFLVEEVPFGQVEQQIESLGTKGGGASLDKNRRGQGVNVIAALKDVLPKHGAVARPGPLRLAQSDIRQQPGFVLDYNLLSSQSDATLQGDTTYFVSGLVNLSGTTRIEGGTVIKFTNSTSAEVSMSGPLICRTERYRPAVLTTMDDDTVGDTIAGSSGSPTNANSGTYLYSSVSDPTNALQYLRLSYAGTGLKFDGLTNGVWDCQFVKCVNDVDSYNQKAVCLYNVLMTGSSNGVVNSTNVLGQQLTVDVCSNLVSASGATLILTNSILTAVDAVGVGSPTYDHVLSASSGSGIYQTVGAASYYLADSSTNRDAGTTNINADLLAQLGEQTTYPPIEWTNDFTNDTTLSPQASRDTDTPDLGYHYDPLDYVVSGRTVSGKLTLTNGVALGVYGTSYGLSLTFAYFQAAGGLVSSGSAAQLNWIVRYNTVQEQSVATWLSSAGEKSVQGSSVPTIRTDFTGWSLLGGNGYHYYNIYGYQGSWMGGNLPMPAFNHCRFGGGRFWLHSSDGLTAHASAAALTNCLWERVAVTMQDKETDPQWYLYNNLFYGGSVYYSTFQGSPGLVAYDNLFDRTAITNYATSTCDYNGYVTNYSRLSTGTHDVLLTNSPVYLTSYLGSYYYPTNDGMLSTLIDMGSRNATNAGLYHFTTTVDQVKETNSVVDIGFHYVATDTNGVPVDTDGDGVPDYVEDANGNGAVDSGETDWQSANDLGLRVFITEPRNGSAVP